MDDGDAYREEQWRAFIEKAASCSVDGCIQVFEQLSRAYEEPSRAYHNLNHVGDCLQLLEIVTTIQYPAVELAIWFHDAVYQPLSSSNEQDSADLMRKQAVQLGFQDSVIADAYRLILITTNHHEASAFDEQLLVDIDCSILAADTVKYDWYSNAIRAEYASVSDSEYQAGRTQFLNSLLKCGNIFHTSWAKEFEYEKRARINIARERDMLGD